MEKIKSTSYLLQISKDNLNRIASALVVFALCFFVFATHAQKADKRTAFDKIKFIDNHPYAFYENTWLKIMSIANHPVDAYIDLAKKYDPSDWKFGFTRYTHYMMDDLEIKRDESVVVEFERNGKIVHRDLALKKENRELATEYLEQQIGKNKLSRKHRKNIPKEYHYLNTRVDGYEKKESDWINPEDAIHDLEHLEWQLVNNYSYLNLTGFDFELGIDAIISDLQEGISKPDFGLQLKMFMANFGDGHSSVSMSRYVLPEDDQRGGLPFRIIRHQGLFYAVDATENSFYKKSYPQLVKVNGIAIDEFYAAAKRMASKTTAGFIEETAVAYMSQMRLLLAILGQRKSDRTIVTLSDGNQEIELRAPIQDMKRNELLTRHYQLDTILPNNIGYIAMNKKMDDEDAFILALEEAMLKVKNTDGLLIDIRGNGGGSRQPLKTLLPYFIQQPVVCNVARFRINEMDDVVGNEGYLPRRFAYPEESNEFSLEEKSAIQLFKMNFNPSDMLEDKEYSEYHYMIARPNESEKVFYYDKPVIVLIDAGCFSASDIFAAGMRQGDNVRLLGVTTGGGSGFAKSRELPNSGIKVRLSRIVSYQPDGELYDGHGVVPDIEQDYSLDDKMGLTDDMMTKAVDLLLGK